MITSGNDRLFWRQESVSGRDSRNNEPTTHRLYHTAAFTLIGILAIMATLLGIASIVGRMPIREQGRLAVIALPSAEASQVASALTEIARVHSDNDKRVELARLSREVLPKYDSQVRSYFFAAANTIGSDGERRKLILSIADVERLDAELTEMMIDFARSIQSPHEKATALIEVADHRPRFGYAITSLVPLGRSSAALIGIEPWPP